ncbi:glycosyltransferase family 4 protein [Fusobacterium sp. SYSU M8D902]|uniref:glycosyltransferase family 4 protein n=1 Tax=Fusobacterium sp. SYSU M8D902 TaxID=3159562 RepID=UPI0032E39458
MNKKKILMVHNFYQIGGGEHTVYKNEVEMLRENGHEVIEYTRNNNELRTSKLKLLLLPFTTIWSFKTYYEIKKIIKKNKIDILHCHNTFPLISPSVYYAAINERIPVVQTIHNFRFLCPCAILYRNGKICEECIKNKSFIPALKYKCYRNSRIQTFIVVLMLTIHKLLGTYRKINYIFLTEFNKQKFKYFLNIFGKNIFIKPNFVKEFDISVKECMKNKVFIFYGRLEKNKGILSLVEMWQKVPKDYVLHIYGTGTYKKYIERIVKDNDNIIYYGFKEQKVIFQDILKSSAVLITSEWYETFGMGIPESFSLGTPVICTKLGTPKTIVEESKGGLIYKINDYNSFYNSLNEIVKNNKYYSENAKLYFDKKLNIKKNYERLCDIYDKAKII